MAKRSRYESRVELIGSPRTIERFFETKTPIIVDEGDEATFWRFTIDNNVAYMQQVGFDGTDTDLRIALSGFDLAIALGDVEGYDHINKFGQNTAISSANDEDIWDVGGDYTFIAAADTLDIGTGQAADDGTEADSGIATGGSTTTIVDTGATWAAIGIVVGDVVLNDTKFSYGIVTVVTETILTVEEMLQDTKAAPANVAGDTYRIATTASTGAAVVEVQGLDANYIQIFENVILNGAADVTTTASFLRTFRAKVSLAGSGGGNSADLDFTTTVGGVIQARIITGNNMTLMAIFTVPAGKTALMPSYYWGINKQQSAAINAILIGAPFGEPLQIKHVAGGHSIGSTDFAHPFVPPKRFLAKTDLKVRASVGANGVDVSGGMDLYLVDN